MMVRCVSCSISKSVTPDDEKKNKALAQTILNDMDQVRTINNKILDAILEVSHKWNTSPIVWVANVPYRIQLIKRCDEYVILHQCAISYYYSNSGKERYTCVAKRQVKIVF
jgi:hypothetical protein